MLNNEIDTTIPDASLPRGNEAYIEIKGREGSTAVYRKRVNSLEDVTDAELQKIIGIARRLPVEAFDALLDAETIELMLNPDGWIWVEKLGGEMRCTISKRFTSSISIGSIFSLFFYFPIFIPILC